MKTWLLCETAQLILHSIPYECLLSVIIYVLGNLACQKVLYRMQNLVVVIVVVVALCYQYVLILHANKFRIEC
jgi:hypothetical protein